jgi:hypothetical protein
LRIFLVARYRELKPARSKKTQLYSEHARYHVGTTVYKAFSDEEFKGKVTFYDSTSKLYHILYEDDDTEDFYHNKVRDQQKPALDISKRWKRPKQPSTKQINCLLAKYAPMESDYTEHVMSLKTESIRAIASLHHTNVDMSEEAIPNKIIKIAINTLNSDSITAEEQALGHFTRRKLKKLTAWNEWEAGEHKQLDQFYGQKMFGEAIDPMLLPKQAVILRPHWNYIVKRSGVRRSRLCCNGSKMAAPQLHALANTWSSCVEQPIQHIFLALCASQANYLRW